MKINKEFNPLFYSAGSPAEVKFAAQCAIDFLMELQLDLTDLPLAFQAGNQFLLEEDKVALQKLADLVESLTFKPMEKVVLDLEALNAALQVKE